MKDATKRNRDFSQRAKADPASVHLNEGIGRFLTINPMSDEPGLLAALGIDSSSCVKVDLYWESNGDVVFVQIATESYSLGRRPGYYVRRAPNGYVNLVAVVADRTIASDVVLRVLREAGSRLSERREIGEALVALE